MGEHHYPGRVHRRALVMTGLLVAAPLVASIALLGVSQPFPAVVLVGALLLVVVLYGSAFKVRYELDDRELRFRQGVFAAWRISLHSITRVMPSRGQGPLSFDSTEVLLIEAGTRIRVVAPPDPERFLRELAARAPHLRRYGTELRGAPVNTYGIA